MIDRMKHSFDNNNHNTCNSSASCVLMPSALSSCPTLSHITVDEFLFIIDAKK